MKKKLEVRTKSLKQMGADVLEAWNNAEAGQRLCQRIGSGFVNVPEAEGMAEIEAVVELERAFQQPRNAELPRQHMRGIF